jgi:hypothetical protein
MEKKVEKMLSLYDYLGKAAGSQLGKQVAEYAKLRKAKCSSRHVSNPAYTGEVLLYTKEFLDECFNAKKVFSPKNEDYTEINTQLVEDLFNKASEGVF